MEKGSIGLFGGAFNPIHYGHLFIAKEAKRIFSLEKVIFVPTGTPAFYKENLLDKNIRAELVKMSVSNKKDFETSFYEINKNKISYFVETLNYFETIYPNKNFFLILGEDTFLKFHLWKNPEDILGRTKIIIAKRFEGNFLKSKNYSHEYFTKFINRFFFMDHPLFPISSTLVRKRIHNGEFISYLVPENVEREIVNNGYYKEDRSRS